LDPPKNQQFLPVFTGKSPVLRIVSGTTYFFYPTIYRIWKKPAERLFQRLLEKTTPKTKQQSGGSGLILMSCILLGRPACFYPSLAWIICFPAPQDYKIVLQER